MVDFNVTANLTARHNTTMPSWNDQTSWDDIFFRISLWRISHGYILFPLCILGMLGNILSVIVLNRQAVRSSTIAVYLRCLAVADFFVLATAIFRFRCYKLFLGDEGEKWTVYHFDPYIQVYVEPLHWISLGVSSFVIITLSMERYLAVRYPVEIKQTCTPALVWIIVGFIAVVTSVITIPNFFAYTVESFQIDTSKVVLVAKLTEMGRRTLYHCTYHNYVIPVVWYVIPCMVLAVFSILLSKHVKRSSKIRTHAKQNTHANRNLNTLIILIVVVYIGCNFPNCIFVFYNLVHHTMEHNICTYETQGLSTKTSRAYDVIEVIGELLNVLNSCINIIVYCLVGSKFRRELKKFMQCHRCRFRINKVHTSDFTRNGATGSDVTSGDSNKTSDGHNGKRRY